MTVGILALQGDFREHEETLRRIGAPTLQVRLPKHLEQVDRLIIPGGESTAIGKLLVLYNLLEPVRERARAGMPLWALAPERSSWPSRSPRAGRPASRRLA